MNVPQGNAIHLGSGMTLERRDSPLNDVSNRLYLTPRWRGRSDSSESYDLPLPLFDNENSPQPRDWTADDVNFMNPTSTPTRPNGPAPLPFLPLEADNETTVSQRVRLAPRYDRSNYFGF